MNDTQHNDSEENFAELLENSFTQRKSFQPGQIVETRIVSITDDCIFLQMGGKSEGQLDAAELLDADGDLTVSEGDTIKVFFVTYKNGVNYFTTKISGEKAGNAVLQTAFESGIPVEGSVEKEIKGGFEIKIGDTRAFCPYSQLGMKRVDDPNAFIGKTLTFKIMEYRENGRNILVSNRAILEAEQQEKIEALKKTLKENTVVKGTVTSIQSFGAFVDLSGVQALIPVSEISRTRVENVQSVLTVGQEVEALVIKIDWQNERIALSLKQLEADPWDTVTEKYTVGMTLSGKIVRLTAFGAFVALEPGLDGLVHISDLEGETRINHPRDVVKEGQVLEVQINSIDADNKRISLKRVVKSGLEGNFDEYMTPDSETFSPFGNLLKDKMKKKGK